jgi:hypothetical protein
MSLNVYVYDDSMIPLGSGLIEIIETDHWGMTIDIQPSTSMGSGLYGASLQSPAPPEPINIFVDDTSGQYAPAALGHLNGKLPAKLDVALYPLPSGPGGTTGHPYQPFSEQESHTPTEIAEYIREQVDAGTWTDAEGVGVGNLVDTVMRALNSGKWAIEGESRLARWRAQLLAVGITMEANLRTQMRYA